jgi:hypothetical protein
VRVKARLLFEPRDLWVGIYWNRPVRRALQVYVCIVPMLPLLVTLMWPASTSASWETKEEARG